MTPEQAGWIAIAGLVVVVTVGALSLRWAVNRETERMLIAVQVIKLRSRSIGRGATPSNSQRAPNFSQPGRSEHLVGAGCPRPSAPTRPHRVRVTLHGR